MIAQPNREVVEFYRRSATLGTTERYRTATAAETYYLSLQYEGRGLADWYEQVPLRKRKPRIILPLYREAIEGLERFVWGGHRHPSVVVSATRTDETPETSEDIGPRLRPEDAAQLTTFARAMITQGRLSRAIREASRMAMVTTSSLILLGVRGGYLTAHSEPGKHCTPTWSKNNPRELESVDILYQYEREQDTGFGTTQKTMWWYRRIVDEQFDTVFKEIPVRPGVPPKWEIDPEKTVRHGLGFFPGRWIRTCPDSTDAIDGRPVIDPTLYATLDAINYTLSQRQRAVEYGTDPQGVRKGVPEAGRETLNKNPGKIWDLPADASLEFIELEGSGVESATKHLTDLRERFLEAVSVVMPDPKITAGKLSGVVLEFLHAPMIALASDLRCDLGDEGYAGLVATGLRLITTLTLRGDDVWIPGAPQAARTLQAAQLRGVWLDPPITLQWPGFFTLDATEEQTRVVAATTAVDAKLISKRTATRYIGPIFSVEDPDAEHEAIETEQAEAQELAQAKNPEAGQPEGKAAPVTQEPDENGGAETAPTET